MTMVRFMALIGTALMVAAPTTAARTEAARTDWAGRVAVTPAGSYVRGNPDAPRKLVEYASYTCDHCAHFSAEAATPLARAIAGGKVSIEFRHALRDRLDLTAALLARCAGPARFFAASEAIFAEQKAWIDRTIAYEQAERAALEAASPVERIRMTARASGLTAIVARFGVSAERANACLADPAQQKTLIDQANEAWSERRIPGTPHFILNGTPVAANDWPGLAPL
ncbi:thioredoxin domain-containing protein [Sphingomonas changnyeongensis]|uniref:Thioredoxin domain-containing protein n=1 Tax=Sphingomonas changnyeongensis TaxID=2698679 RepID=A0A7Z2S8L9_9SPHN|nr:thioredoxin domain-containing protein [Sphingomonas changnyeongensis]QHL89954.1 thioredoxin domain-containing protein [Sphingomonas changnyeongensis]